MIIAAFQDDTSGLVVPRPLFRSAPLRSWIKSLFDYFVFTDELRFSSEDNYLLFHPDKLLLIEKEDLLDVLHWVSNEFQSEGQVVSLFKDALLLLPGNTLPKGNIAPADLLEMKRTVPDVECDYRVFDSIDEPLETERAIVDYQIRVLTAAGVQIEDFSRFYMESGIPVGPNSVIGSGCVIKGESVVGDNCRLYPGVYIENSRIGDDVVLLPGSTVIDSELKGGNRIGPYAHLRAGVVIEESANVGNFVEMKNTRFGKGSKAMHLSYVGDANVGEKVNIGAGTITCNYDGVNKNPTTIGDRVFIGSGTELIAPITIETDSYVAAGSTINGDVPSDALAVARAKQRNVAGWVKRQKRKNDAKKKK